MIGYDRRSTTERELVFYDGLINLKMLKIQSSPLMKVLGIRMGQFTIQVTMNCTNVAGEAIEYDFFTCTQLEGSIEVSENSLAINLGNLDVNSVREAEMNAPEIHHTNPALGIGEGGSFFSSLKHFINKVAKGVGAGARAVGKVAPALGMLAPEFAAPLMAASKGVGSLAGVAQRATGGGVSGGRMRRLGRRRR
jgi:hypothetical protein